METAVVTIHRVMSKPSCARKQAEIFMSWLLTAQVLTAPLPNGRGSVGTRLELWLCAFLCCYFSRRLSSKLGGKLILYLKKCSAWGLGLVLDVFCS